MTNKIANGVLMFVTTLAISCNAKTRETAAPVVDKEQIKSEIQAKEDEFAATYNAGGLKDISYYSDDATTFYPNRAPLVGKKAISDNDYDDKCQLPLP